MSDLDQAIRDVVAFGGLPLTGRFEAAFAAVLDLHAPESYGMRVVCSHCIGSDEDPIDYPCATIRGIARELRVWGVSSPDAPAPRPEPVEAKWKRGDHVQRPAWGWTGTVGDTVPEHNRYRVHWDHLLERTLTEGASWCTAEELAPLTEVLSESGTAGDR